MRRPIGLAIGLMLLDGCVTQRVNDPFRSATEELLISSAADRAADELKLKLPSGTRIYVDAGDFAGQDTKDADAKYAVGRITDAFLRQGMRLALDREDADVVIAIRAGALGIDKSETFFGIPSIPLPVPFAPGAIETTPQVAFYDDLNQSGIAKFAFTGTDVKTGALVATSNPKMGYSRDEHFTALLLITWQRGDLSPPGANQPPNK